MNIRIDKAHCVGNARCAAVAAALYPLDDDGYVASEGFEVPARRKGLSRAGRRGRRGLTFQHGPRAWET
ncbi:MAG: hypothetical protein QM676_01595 [Novosphingobium sp.]